MNYFLSVQSFSLNASLVENFVHHSSLPKYSCSLMSVSAFAMCHLPPNHSYLANCNLKVLKTRLFLSRRENVSQVSSMKIRTCQLFQGCLIVQVNFIHTLNWITRKALKSVTKSCTAKLRKQIMPLL